MEARPHVNVTINGREAEALVDTGSSFTLIDQSLTTTEPDATTSIETATGELKKVHGPTRLSVDGKPTSVYVTEGINSGISILGTDWLRKNSALIDYTNNRILLNGTSKALHFGRTGHCPIDSLTKLLLSYDDLFNEEVGEMTVDYPMRITTNSPPIAQPSYRAPLTKRYVIDAEIDSMLNAGIIRPSSSPWASPVLLIPKKTGDMRFCVDYRKLNAVTERDNYPLPRIQDIFDSLGGSAVFSTLDLRSGYWQVPVAEHDRAKTAFVCHRGQFEFNRVPFGLTNAPAVFQRVMTQVLQPVIGKCALVYIDDIIIYSTNRKQHEEDLRQVLDLLHQAGITLKRTKCEFAKDKVELLGYQVSAEGIAALPSKTNAILEMPAPKDKKAVRSFLGMTNYYRQLIPGYAQIAEPLVRLTKASVRFKWTTEQQQALDELKSALASDAILAYPDVQRPYKLYTDACDYAIGAILVQDDDAGIERPIHYLSHQLGDIQRRWPTIEKEAYAAIYALEKLRPYLYGATFTIFTDHKPLKSLFLKEMHNTKIQRWAVMFAEYGAHIEYRQGKNNVRADMLSRIKPTISAITRSRTRKEDIEQSRIPTLMEDNIPIQELRQQQQAEFPNEWNRAQDDDIDYSIFHGVLVSDALPHAGAEFKERIVLPVSFRRDIIRKSHVAVGHMAVLKTLRRVTEKYVWPGMHRDIKQQVRQCPQCLVHTRSSERVPMGEMPLPANPMEVISMDFIGPFRPPDSGGNRYVLVIIDHLTSWAEAIPTPGQSALEIIDAFTKHYLPRHGYPRVVINDNGQGFGSKAWSLFLHQAGVELHRTTAVHPQSNGKVERANRTIKEILAKLVNNEPDKWSEKLQDAVAAYRVASSSSTGYTPFYLLYGRGPQVPLERFTGGGQPFGNRLDDLAQAHRAAKEKLRATQQQNAEWMAKRANAGEICVGDYVLVKAEERLTNTARWDPGYIVVRVNGSTYTLREQATGREKKLHREKIKWAEPGVDWSGTPRRPRRQRAQVASGSATQ